MTQKTSIVVRATSGLASVALALTGVSLVALPATAAPAAPAAASSPVTVYNSIPDILPGSYPSLGFQATQTDEFGDHVKLAAGPRVLTDVTVGFTNWSCESDFTLSGSTWTSAPSGTPCVSAMGSAFTHPITLNVYEVDESAATPTVGALVTSVTTDVTVPFRPSADATCATPTQWKDAAGTCRNGFAFNSTFTLTDTPVVSDDVIITVAYNTNTSGITPLGVAGPYDSFNVSVNSVPTIGTDVNPDQMFVDYGHGPFYSDGGAGGTDFLRADDDWASVPGLLLTVNATTPAASTITDATVNQRDVKPTENSSTYQSWHEGYNNATPAYSVQPDGLHLGNGSPSQITKGTDVPNSVKTEAALRALIQSAEVVLASGSTTFQVPVHYRQGGVENFTTLRSTSLTGAGTKTFALADNWATTRIMGVYATRQQEDTLGALLNELFAIADPGSVRLGGFGVQADASAVVSSIVWDATRHNFFQPTAEACAAVVAAPATTSVASGGWTFGETRATGHNVFTADGLHVYTESDSSTDKAAGYKALSIPLSEVGVPAIDLTVNSGGSPSIQLGIDLTGDGTWDGYLVNEGAIYGVGMWWTNKSTFGVAPGGGYPSLGTLNDYLVANPEARVVNFGYSLGSGLYGDAVIHSLTVGCQSYSFAAASPAAALTDVTVTGNDIRPNEAIYAGWHEGYSNSRRAYSVKADGLHLAEGDKASQILYGLSTPLATTALESVITGASIEVVSGVASLQIPLFYGSNSAAPGTQRFTTLRQQDLGAGTHTVSVSDRWITSGAIRDAAGTTLYPAGTSLPLADLAAVISAQGDVKVLGFGVQADALAVVKSLTANTAKYTFSPIAAIATTSVRITDPEIATSETSATYSSWHEGYANATKAYAVTEDGLTLGAGVHSQIIKGIPLSAKTLADNLSNASVTVSGGNVTYQVPITFGPSSTFTTLRSTSLTAGTTTFDLTSSWASSRSFGTITANTAYALGDILDQLNLQTNVHALAFGVQADTTATVTSISWDGTQYVFSGPISIAAPSITGTPTVGQALTATSGAVSPTNATVSFQWRANGTAIAGATSATYVLTGNELGKTVSVEATAALSGYTNSSAISFGTDPIAAAPLATGTPSISGIAQSHRMLTASAGTWGPGTVSFSYQWLKNGVPVSGETAAALTLASTDIGATFSVTVTGTKLGYITESVASASTTAVIARDVSVTRIAGAHRYATAVAISEFGFAAGEPDIVYIATGAGYADALSAGPAAAHDNAPLLLTAPDSIPVEVAAELVRLAPRQIIVVGSDKAVSGQVFAQLGNLSFQPQVMRIGGVDRFETSRMIANRFDTATTAYIASGLNFPDALSAGPAAARFDGPVILVNGASLVDAETLAVFTRLGVTTVKIAGDNKVVSDAIQSQLSASYTVKRNSGADRYATAIAINADDFTSADTVFLATGNGYADALTGSVLAGIQGSPLFISPANCVPAGVRNAITALDAHKVIVLGSTAVLDVAVEDLVVC
ncbi:MAG: cell wall-binding repeat-containing protein [Rhodoglobus sp.]